MELQPATRNWKQFSDLCIKCAGSNDERYVSVYCGKTRLIGDEYMIKAVFPCHLSSNLLQKKCRLLFTVDDVNLAGTQEFNFSLFLPGQKQTNMFIIDFAEDRKGYETETTFASDNDCLLALSTFTLKLPKLVADNWYDQFINH